ncbi:MAG: hypothetical protein ISS69_08855 [Phycisphaerae bacterium]|nr:hypothetical protein [Phycisphaerae bacterium]
MVGVATEDVTLDLHIPGVLNLPATAGSVTSSIDGDLALGGEDYLSLTLKSATVTNIR